MVDTGNEPPLRAFRAKAALVQATAELRTAEVEEITGRRSLAALLGATVPPADLLVGDLSVPPVSIAALATLDVRLAAPEQLIADARLHGPREIGGAHV